MEFELQLTAEAPNPCGRSWPISRMSGLRVVGECGAEVYVISTQENKENEYEESKSVCLRGESSNWKTPPTSMAGSPPPHIEMLLLELFMSFTTASSEGAWA